MTERRPNYPGIIAGAFTLFIWGAIWYTVLGSVWLAALGRRHDQVGRYGFAPFIISLLAGVLVSYCFDNMLWHYEQGNAAKGAQVGFLAGVCIFLAMVLEMYFFQGESITLMVIDGAYGVIGFTLTGAVVGWLRSRAGRRATAAA